MPMWRQGFLICREAHTPEERFHIVERFRLLLTGVIERTLQMQRRNKMISIGTAALGCVALLVVAQRVSARSDDNEGWGLLEQSRIVRGFAINPVKLNFRGKNPLLVGLGAIS